MSASWRAIDRWARLIDGLKPDNWSLIRQIDAWLAPRCVLCAAATRGTTLCGACCAALPWREPQRVAGGVEVYASFRYAFPIVECIGRAKLGGQWGLARELGRWASTRPPPAAGACELVCAIPQHWRRAVARGYNQALEIAKPIAAALHVPLVPDALRRDAPGAQRGLGRRARLRNLVGRMSAQGRVAGRRVLVIDDVTTTGASFREAARALRAAGAAAVVCWAIAAVE